MRIVTTFVGMFTLVSMTLKFVIFIDIREGVSNLILSLKTHVTLKGGVCMLSHILWVEGSDNLGSVVRGRAREEVWRGWHRNGHKEFV